VPPWPIRTASATECHADPRPGYTQVKLPFPFHDNKALQSDTCHYKTWDRLDAAAYAAELAPKYPDICDADVGYERYAAHVHSLANMRREHTSTHPRAVVPQHVSSRG
jgi:hypothetical protein